MIILPSGKEIDLDGIPKGVTKDELKAKLIRNGLATEEDFISVAQAQDAPRPPMTTALTNADKIDAQIKQGTDAVISTVKGIPSAAAYMAQQTVLQPLSGIAGLASLADSPETAARTVGNVQGLGYQPSDEGAQVLSGIGNFYPIKKIGEGLQYLSNTYGDYMNENYGPVAGGVGKGAPEAVLGLMGGMGRKPITISALTPEAAARKAEMESIGITPLANDIAPTVDMGKKTRELMKSDNIVKQRYFEANEKLKQLLDNQRNNTPIYKTSDVNQSLDALVIKQGLDADNAIQDAYTAAKTAAANAPVPIELNSLLSEMKYTIKAGSDSSDATNMVRDILRKNGIDYKKPTQINIEQAEKIRQDINSKWANSASKPLVRHTLTDLKSLLDSDVADHVGQDYFKDARQLVINQHKREGSTPNNKFDVSQKDSIIEKIKSGKKDQDQIINLINNSSAKDFAQVKKYFTENSGPEGIAAWDAYKSNVISDALDEATKYGIVTGKVNGDPKTTSLFNVARFKKPFEIMKNKSEKGVAGNRYENLFTADERDLIDKIIKTGEYRKVDTMVDMGYGVSSGVVDKLADAEKVDLPVSKTAAMSFLLSKIADKGRNIKNARDIRNATDIDPQKIVGYEASPSTTGLPLSASAIAISESQNKENERNKRIEQQRKALSDKDMRMKQLMGIP